MDDNAHRDNDKDIQAIENAMAHIAQCNPYRFTVRRNPHKQTITAEFILDLPDRPVKAKIIADYEQWPEIATRFLEKEFITFEEIQPFFFRLPKDVREELRAAWDKDMAYRVYHAAEATFDKNPLARPKLKGRHAGKEYSTGELVRLSRHVFVFLSYWLGRPEREWPPELVSFLKQNKPQADLIRSEGGQHSLTKVARLTKEIVEIYFNTYIGDPDKLNDDDAYLETLAYFKARYIFHHKGLKLLRRSYDQNGYLPNRYPLNKVFPPEV